MPTKKEEVLRWYESAKAALAEAGIDLKNPADLMRIRTMYLKKDERYNGVDYEKSVSFGYAFMPKKLGDDLEAPEYVTKRPEISRDVQTVIYPEVEREWSEKIRERGRAYRALTDARKQNRPLEEIKQLEEAFEQADIASQKADVVRREKLNEIFADHDQWMLTNSRVFDPEQNYEQIEELYNRAKNGSLFVEELNTEPGHIRQVVVKADGTAAVTQDLHDVDKIQYTNISKSISVDANGRVSPERTEILDAYSKALTRMLEGKTLEEKQNLYDKYGVPEPLESFPKKPRFDMREPPNPRTFTRFGIRSWFGRLFGNKAPYEAYDRYTAALADFRQKEADYNEHHEEWEAQITARNEKRTEVYKMILDEVYREDYPEGTLNVGKLRSGIELFERNVHLLLHADKLENVYNVEFEAGRMGRNLELAFEGHENPNSFNQDGTRNKEVSNNYWKNRAPLADEFAEYDKREQATLLKGKVHDTVRANHEKERAEHHEEIEQYREAKKYIEQYRQRAANDPKYYESHFWVACQPTELFEKIGALYGKDAKFGMRVFFGAATQNRAFDLKGEFNPNAVSDKKCGEDISSLVLNAYFPNSFEKNNARLKRLAAFGEKDYDPREVADSLTSLAATGCGYKTEDLDAIDLQTGVCAAVLGRLVKAVKVDTSKPLLNEKGEDVRIAGDNEREVAMKLAGACNEVQKGFAFSKNHASVKKQPEAKELTTKRSMDLGL